MRPPTSPRRWRDELEGGSSPDQRIGALLRRVPAAPPLSEAHLARVGRRMAPGASRRVSFVFRWGLAALLVAGSGGVVFARHEIVSALRTIGVAIGVTARPAPRADRADAQPRTARVPSAPANVARAALSGSAPPPAIPEEQPVSARVAEGPAAEAPLRPPPPEARKVGAPSRARPVAPPPRREVAASPARSSLAAEAAALGDALRSLRRHGDPAAALRGLDAYEAVHAAGALRGEAALVRAEALFALDRRREALTLLETLPLDHGPRVVPLRLARAELRAQRDCVRALRDFDWLVARPLDPPTTERALRGRALCRELAGDRAGAAAAFEAYIARFPSGAWSAEARARLAATSKRR